MSDQIILTTSFINNLGYWKPLTIIGANTRNVTIPGNLQIGATYRIGFTWGSTATNNITYREYTHKTNANNDIERYIHDSVIGLLPNVLAIGNNGNIGFRIYAALGTQNTDGFILSIDIKTSILS